MGELVRGFFECEVEQADITGLLHNYFESNWFSSNWAMTFVDFSLPDGLFRDDGLNVNNFVEASFKVFDKVFLESTSNKRLDTLATIILEDFLPYYEIIIETLKHIIETKTSALQTPYENKQRLSSLPAK